MAKECLRPGLAVVFRDENAAAVTRDEEGGDLRVRFEIAAERDRLAFRLARGHGFGRFRGERGEGAEGEEGEEGFVA